MPALAWSVQNTPHECPRVSTLPPQVPYVPHVCELAPHLCPLDSRLTKALGGQARLLGAESAVAARQASLSAALRAWTPASPALQPFLEAALGQALPPRPAAGDDDDVTCGICYAYRRALASCLSCGMGHALRCHALGWPRQALGTAGCKRLSAAGPQTAVR